MTYCYKCTTCGAREEHESDGPEMVCCSACMLRTGEWLDMTRDYKAESVGIGAGVKVSRDGTSLDQARLFLPSNDEFKGPGDEDGKKGARKWLDDHAPKEPGGHNPLLEIERKSF